MNNENSLTRSHKSLLSRLVEKACRHWESSSKAPRGQYHLASGAPHTFTVAVSREAGTQGSAIARETARLLNWRLYDHELLELIAKDMGLPASLLESVDERQQSWLLETTQAFLSAPRPSDWGPLVTESSYAHHLVKTVLALGVHGECVIVGRGAVMILPAATTLRVRLSGSAADRAGVLRRQLGISEREATRRIHAIDRERADFVRGHFFKDVADPGNYDLVLNTPRLSVAQCAEMIAAMLHQLQAAQRENTVAHSAHAPA